MTVTLTDDKILISDDGVVTADVVSQAIVKHKTLVTGYKENIDYYKGNHKIKTKKEKAEFKPDYRLMVNFAKYIVDTYTAYFIGIPIKVTHETDEVNEFIRIFRENNDLEDNEYELAKIMAIYGRAYEFLSQDEVANTIVTYTTPINTFVVYDNTIYERPLFAVNYSTGDKDMISGDVFTFDEHIEISGTTTSVSFGESEMNVYQGLPIIEYIENKERQSVFENVKSLIDAINTTLSEKMNDVDALADAYMKILGAELDDKGLEYIRDNRIINLVGEQADNVAVDFMAKPSGDTTQENLLNRLTDLIFQIAMVANISDKDFSGSSGVALEFKLQSMKNLAQQKERKMLSGIRKRYKLIFGIPTNVNASNRDEWKSLKYRFTRNTPRNISDEAQTAKLLEGVVPKETQLSVLSIVDNPHDTAIEMEKQVPDVLPDFQKEE
ncbi:phage portal protein [Pseudolactococcus piscium]|uniref:Phage portal protein n=1 Tax=Pseudolactococcus piscium MKFS47 TaxID=297352 RepID=A0A0D6DYX7_9LACT|nr:phage portal protein [Lactococcus piscium]CEN29147.1 Phage portal protein [Lactococcus piscium MKFS47]